MTDLCASKNFIWSTTAKLGKGASGVVYKGMNKTNGELVAVKVSQRARYLSSREQDVLQRINHENIVKLLAIEEAYATYQKVIVMELCTGGSLQNVLQQPANVFGLQDHEFLLLLDHLTAGTKYLRAKDLIHRDLKPDNIMKFICDNGKIIYKLTDFGSARELADDQHFKSLHGTEDYLRPDMYAQAYLNQTPIKYFDATIDLWSIGATLYHAATGNVPFRPYGGRCNRRTMYKITVHKSTGVISGIQKTENGQIEYRSDLPNDCQLSVALRKIITPLVAGLLEANLNKVWSFNQFFSTVADILSLTPLNLFHVAGAISTKIYTHPNFEYEQFQKYLTDQSEIPADEQIILYRNRLFGGHNPDSTFKVDDYINTTESKPIFLFSCNNNRIQIKPDQKFPEFNVFHQTKPSLATDVAEARKACIIAHQYKRCIEMYSSRCKLICDAVDKFEYKIKKELRTLKQVWQHLLDITTILAKTIQFLPHYVDPQQVLKNNLNKALEMTEKYVIEIIGNVQNHIGENDVKPKYNVVDNNMQALNMVTTLIHQQHDSWMYLDQLRLPLSINMKNFYKLERIKISKTHVKITKLLDEVFTHFQQLRDNSLDTWYNSLQTDYLQLRTANKVMNQYGELLKQFELNLSTKSEIIKKQLTFDTNPINKKQLIHNHLEELIKTVADINKMSMENFTILDQLIN